jgi:hypothetical protein
LIVHTLAASLIGGRAVLWGTMIAFGVIWDYVLPWVRGRR